MNQRDMNFVLTSPLWIEKFLWRAIVVTGVSSCSEETRSRRFIPEYQPEEIGGHIQEVLHWRKFDKQRKTNSLNITKLAPWHSRRGRETCHTCKPFKGNLNIYIQQLIQLQCMGNPPDMTWHHQKRWDSWCQSSFTTYPSLCAIRNRHQKQEWIHSIKESLDRQINPLLRLLQEPGPQIVHLKNPEGFCPSEF
jgi:hypothetical protein